jgi:hypothetical protein
MRSDKSSRGIRQDRKRVAGGQDYEVEYLMEICNCSREDVVNAIKRVGNNREKLEQELRKTEKPGDRPA